MQNVDLVFSFKKIFVSIIDGLYAIDKWIELGVLEISIKAVKPLLNRLVLLIAGGGYVWTGMWRIDLIYR